MKTLKAIPLLLCAVLAGSVNAQSLEDESVAWLQEFIQIDTINPPGNEYRAVDFYSKIFDAEGKYAFHIGSPGDASGHLGVPKGVGVDSHGHIYIVDSYFSAIQVFNQNGAFLMDLGEPGEGPGRLQVPTGLTVDSHDRIYVCDSYNNRIQLLEYVGGKTDD